MAYSRVHAIVDLDAICHNVHILDEMTTSKQKIIAVLKADGYGHGALPIAEVLEQEPGVYGYGLATVDEALSLRRHGIRKPILILGHTFREQYEDVINNAISSSMYDYEAAKELSKVAVELDKKAYIHIMVDTGMNRLGFQVTTGSIEKVVQINYMRNIKIEGIFTHFYNADDEDKTSAIDQQRKFEYFIEELEAKDVRIPLKHCANSAGFLEIPQSRLNLSRIGISLYGLQIPGTTYNIDNLQPALELKSMVVHVKEVHKGETIGYGGTYVVQETQVIATIPVGYGDGYPRSLSNKGYVLIHGQRAPIRGKVCMDQLMVDVSHIPRVHVGDEVVLIGRSGQAYIGVEELGDLSGRFTYEFICTLGKRIPRVYTKYNEVVSQIDDFK